MKRPSEHEEEFFARAEFERRRQLAEETARKLAEEERQRRKDLHWMKCPKCGADLAEIDFRGVQVDKCTGCEGVWLDPGELETIAGLEKPALSRLFSVLKR